MRKYFCLWALVYCCHFGYSQETSSGFDYTAELSRAVTIPNSPEAQAFIKYGDVPLNQYTGTPNVSIPICEIQGNAIRIPISMTYDASGIKVNQLATNVGLGWNLNYGGVVSRQVQGLPDQGQGGYARITDASTRKGLHAVYQSAGMLAYPTENDWYYGDALRTNYDMNNIDTQADTFSFNINGLSGTIAINYDIVENGKYQIFCIDNPEVKIEYTQQGHHITSWIITDTNGTSYEFSKTEYTHTGYSNQQNEYEVEYISSWYITKITTANGEDTITYKYGNGQYYLQGQHLPVDFVWQYYYHPTTRKLIKEEIAQHKQTIYKIKQFNPTAILHNNQLVVGIASNHQREDLSGQSAITDINVFNTLGQTIKRYAFDYSYFVSTMNSSQYAIGDKRLKLDGIREIEIFRNAAGGLITAGAIPKEKTHSFEYYNPTGLPPKSSNAMDVWGYYNGSSIQNNKYVLGNTDSYNEQYGIPETELQVRGANRKADISYAVSGTLQKITYPTGGSTTFYYDAHRGPLEEQTGMSIRAQSTSVIGGHHNHPQNTIDLNDCQGYDDVGYTYNLQNSSHTTFTIDSDNANNSILFDVTFSDTTTGSQQNTNDVKLLCIYKASVPLSYCDIITNTSNPNIVYINMNPKEDFYVSLEEGDYGILLVDGKPNTYLKVNYELLYRNTKSKINTVGGLRLYKTESKPADTSTDTLTKYYYYDILPEDQIITPELVQNQRFSSGVIHQKLMFSQTQMHVGKFIGDINPSNEGTLMRKFYSSNLAPQAKHTITYTHVSEIRFVNDQYQGHITYTFYNDDDGVVNAHQPYFSRYHLNGKLRTTAHYNDQKQMVQQSSQDYRQQTLSTSIPYNGVFMIPGTIYERACITKVNDGTNFGTSIVVPRLFNGGYCGGSGPLGSATTYFASKYRLKPRWTRLEKQIDKQFFGDQVVEKMTRYFYDNTTHKQVTRTETTKDNGEVITSKTYYPQDAGELIDLSTTNTDAITKLSNQHRIAIPIQVDQYVKKGGDSTLLAKTRTHFKDWGDEKIYPEMISTQDPSSTDWEERMRYLDYDQKGHPLEIAQTNGNPGIYIWGYNDRYPIAKIANATYTNMPADVTNLIDQLIVVSNTETSNAEEAQMRTLIASIRAHEYFKNSQVAGYTYDPQIGVTSMTDPRGETAYYQYDGFNRLETVKDDQGNLVSENQYYYKK